MDTPEGEAAMALLGALTRRLRAGSTNYPEMIDLMAVLTQKVSVMDTIIWDVRLAVDRQE